MKKILRYGNYLSLPLILAGTALWLSYGLASFKGKAGLALLLLGGAGLAVYFVGHLSRFKTKNSRLNFIFASNLAVVVLLIAAIVGAVNYLGVKVHKRFDFTAGRVHSLSAQSVQVARSLKKDLEIKAFFSKDNGNLEQLQALLEIYRFHSGRIQATVIDPYLKPELVKQYEIKTDGTHGVRHMTARARAARRSRKKPSPTPSSTSRAWAKRRSTSSRGTASPPSGDSGETGYSEAKTGLEKLSFKVKEAGPVPGGGRARGRGGRDRRRAAKAASRKRDIPAGRLPRKGAGRLLLLLDPYQGAELKPLLAKYGLALEDNIVVEVDPLSQFMGGSYFMPVVAKYPEHAITKGFGYATLFPLARGLARVTPPPRRRARGFPRRHQPQLLGRDPLRRRDQDRKDHPQSRGQGRPDRYRGGLRGGAAAKQSPGSWSAATPTSPGTNTTSSRPTAIFSITPSPGWPRRRTWSPSPPRSPRPGPSACPRAPAAWFSSTP